VFATDGDVKRIKKNMADETKAGGEVIVEPVVVVEPVVETLPDESVRITQKDEEIAKLKEDLENYRKVALKRLGKLPGDAEFLTGQTESGLTVQEEVTKALLEDKEIKRIAKENAELKLALKNRPGAGVGGDGGGGGAEVKDNTFSASQITELRAMATRLGADPEKFIAQAKINLQRRS
jgi:hypothetical protein